MNYIEQINNFWSYTEELEITSSDISVYFALLKYNNSLNWIKSFRCDYAIICQYASVSKNTFYKSINRLNEIGLIGYEKGQRNILKPKISILKLKNRKGTIKEQNEEQNREQNEEQKGNLYKLLNKETIKLINSKTKEVADFLNKNLFEILKENDSKIIYPFDQKEFIEMWQKWKIYKKEQFSFTYKSASTEQAALMALSKLANNPADANKVIMQSIENGWKGFFNLKNNNNGIGKDWREGAARLIEKKRREQGIVD